MSKKSSKKIIVAMSGGVDSSVAAYLLKEEGYNLTGLFMKLFDSERNRAGRCCTLSDSLDARRVCDILDIPFITVDMREIFEREVIDDFISEYQRGRTPNPCARCNERIKFDHLVRYVKKSGFDALATGHYARIQKSNNTHSLYRGIDLKKDQSYFLFALLRDILPALFFPVGNYTKEEIRRIAEEQNLPTHKKKESMEICFIEENRYTDFLEKKRLRTKMGKVYGPYNEILGYHDGITNYTIGQRRGLKVAYGKPLYVKKIDPDLNSVYLDEHDKIKRNELLMKDCNWIENAGDDQFSAYAQIRYNNSASRAIIKKNKNEARVLFAEPKFAITPGQACVISDDESKIIGGGWIE